MKTYIPKLAEIEKKWHVVDVKGQVFGRAVAKVATLLRGKTKPVFTPHLDTGDYVIVLNADKVRLTGKKEKVKTYFHYTGPKSRRNCPARRSGECCRKIGWDVKSC